jgi:hypothetical protein
VEAAYRVKPHTARDRAVLPWRRAVNRTGDQDREAVPFDGGPSGFLVPDISGTPNSMRAGYPLDTLGLGSGVPQVALGPGQKKGPARRDGAWKVGGSNYESFSGFNLTWLMAFVGSEALRLTRVAELAA